jgi:hypothetical protein
MAFLLRAVSGSGLLSSIGLGSVGRAATSLTNPLVHAMGSVFNMGKGVLGSVFGGLGGAARTITGAISTPFKLLSSPVVWLGAGALVIYLVTR